ncbi:MAG: hypothetical protein WCW17_04290 [Patescibacteria group bacterium]|jgi:hypothetical protein
MHQVKDLGLLSYFVYETDGSPTPSIRENDIGYTESPMRLLTTDSWLIDFKLRLDNPIHLPQIVIDRVIDEYKRFCGENVNHKLTDPSMLVKHGFRFGFTGDINGNWDFGAECWSHAAESWLPFTISLPKDFLLALYLQDVCPVVVSLIPRSEEYEDGFDILMVVGSMEKIQKPDMFLRAFSRKLNRWLETARANLQR